MKKCTARRAADPGSNPLRALQHSMPRDYLESRNFRAPVLSAPPADLHYPGLKCFNRIIETGVLHEVGLRNTLEPDPDNTGVGSFRSRAAFFLDSQREFSCFIHLGTRGAYARSRDHVQQTISFHRNPRFRIERESVRRASSGQNTSAPRRLRPDRAGIDGNLLPWRFVLRIFTEHVAGRHNANARRAEI